MKTLYFILILIFIRSFGFSQTNHPPINFQNNKAFLENKGQWPKDVLFKTKMNGGNLWIQKNKLLYHLQDFSSLKENHYFKSDQKLSSIKEEVVHLNFIGNNTEYEVEKQEKSEAYYNYFIGNDESKWAKGVYGYSNIAFKNFYNGIDLVFKTKDEEVKYEFVVDAKKDPSIISFNYSGQQNIKVDKTGNLIIKTTIGEIIEEKPYAYQVVNGEQKEIRCDFKLKKNLVTFKLGSYNKNIPLIIDPSLIFATYCGALSDNFGMTATYGHDGSAYSAGTVYGNNYPTPDPNAFDINSNFTALSGNYGITDVFVSKYSSDGANMLWGTFLGGGDNFQGTETAHSLICDTSDNIYVFGATSSIDFPTTNGAFQTSHGGGVGGMDFLFNGVYFSNQGTDIFLSKISSNGQNLIGSTYVGGSDNDGINTRYGVLFNAVTAYDSLVTNYGDQFRGEIMLDSANNILVGSCSRSIDFPVQNAFQAVKDHGQDGVVFKLKNDFTSMIFSSFYGGNNEDACYSVKIDSSDNIVFAGGTTSNNLTGLNNGLFPSFQGGKSDGFVVKLLPDGSAITNGSYMGQNDYDQVFFVEIDRNDNVFLLGQSRGGTFPTTTGVYSNGNSSNFIIKLNPQLNANIASTRFGNGSTEIHISPSAFLVDICGNVYVSGWGANILGGAPLSGMPVTSNAFQATSPNGFDFYLIVFERELQSLLYGSYLGGSQADEHVDGGTSRFDKNGIVYQSVCGGCGGVSDFPTTAGAWSSQNLSSNCNNVVFKFDLDVIPLADFSADQTQGCRDFTVTLSNGSDSLSTYLWDFGNGDTSSVIFSPVITYSDTGTFEIYLYVTDSVCQLTDTALITISVLDSISIDLVDTMSFCAADSLVFNPIVTGSPSMFVWSSVSNFSDTLNSNLSIPDFTDFAPFPNIYYLQGSNNFCSAMDSVIIEITAASLSLSATDSVCAGELVEVTAINSNPQLSFTYQWSPDSIIPNQSISNVIITQPLSSQYIYVTATSSNGCVVNDSIFLIVSDIVPSSVIASASQNLVAPGTSVVLSGQPSGLLNYTWTPEDDLSDPSMQQTNAYMEQTTIFTLSVSDGICTRSDTVEVKVYEIICDDPYVFIPNAFSPNGDNYNDILFVRGIWIEKMIFRVFDRWGELVFESTDPSIGWDGTFRGKKLDPDVYDFYLDVTCIGGLNSIIKGNVTLMK
ncbi:MAG: gliding motility-associated C-terminal domain-containing protein [Crocinitomicaceae bacterium]|nr:gliding motility-associated C-terminal domain-containing protein [Crocinitomicaceae bacterium]